MNAAEAAPWSAASGTWQRVQNAEGSRANAFRYASFVWMNGVLQPASRRACAAWIERALAAKRPDRPARRRG
jgi:hypothetical protein